MSCTDEEDIKIGLRKAQLYYNLGDYEAAFTRFALCFRDVPNLLDYRCQFVKSLQEYVSQLQVTNSHTTIADCFRTALIYFPYDKEVLYNYLVFLFRLPRKERDEGFKELKSLLDQSTLESERTVRDVALMLLPRWHFRMVNDYQRNMAYYKALLDYNTDKNNIKALDIGTGCGLLSLLASNNSNIDNMIAIESNESLAVISQKVFNDNQKYNIHLINKHSTDVTADDINGKANLLVTEIFDVALFGEYCLDTFIHAWENLLTDNAHVIPASASLYVTGIWCPDVLLKQTVILNIDLPKTRIDAIFTEPYDAVDLKNIDWKSITNTHKILMVDFHDVKQMRDLFNGEETVYFELDCVDNGTINAFAVWFDLHLDENTKITTNPQDANARCWEQAIIYVKNPQKHSSGDKLKLNFTCRDSCVKIDFDTPFGLPKDITHFQVSQDIVTYLNDKDIFDEMNKLTELYNAPIKLMDLSPFPLFGLLMAKKGSTCFCRKRGDSFDELVLYFMRHYQIDKERVVILSHFDYDFHTANENDMDVVLIDVMSELGILDENVFQDLERYKRCLKPRGTLLPKEITLNFQIVSCDYLHYCSRVNDETTFGFQIANQINALAINEQWTIDKEIDYTALTGTGCVVLSLDNKPKEWTWSTKITKSGVPHGVFYWFKLVYADDIVVDTFCSTFYNSACFIVNNDNKILPCDSTVDVTIQQLGGLLNMQCNFQK